MTEYWIIPWRTALLAMLLTAIASSSGVAQPSTPSKPAAKASEPTTAAYTNAYALRQAAGRYAKKGDVKSAYQASVIAWQSIRKEKSHQPTQELAASLFEDMEKYGEQLESPRIRNVLSKPVRYE